MTPLRLVAIDRVSHDTVECIRNLLQQAEAGSVTGVSFCAMQRGDRFYNQSCGEASRNPLKASSMVGALWFNLQRRAHGEKL